MKYGDLGKRFLAALIDSVILNVVAFLIGWLISKFMPAYSFSYPSISYFSIPVVLSLGMPLINITYYTVLEGGSWHATIGKKMMGLYVVDSDGFGITYSRAIMRNLCKIVSSLTFLIGYIMCLFNNEKQCLHDVIAKTYVIEGDAVAASNEPVLICVSGPLAGNKYSIPPEGLMIGRDSVTCQVVIPPSQGNVSRNHCNVTYNSFSDMFIINDRQSTYGTFLDNGTRIQYSKPAAVHSGSRFYIATPSNMFEVRA